MRPFLTIFMPAYNEQDNLVHSVGIIQGKLRELGVTHEIVIIDDGSQDQTGALADELAQRMEGVRAVHHLENKGTGAAFMTARDLAEGEWFILIPADLALEPEELQRYRVATSGADIIVGLRSDRSDYTVARRLISWVNIRLIQVLFHMRERQFQYICMYRTDLLRAIEIKYWGSAFFLAEILIKAKALGAKLTEVEIRYVPRQKGRATGAKPGYVLHTLRDILHFWFRWVTQNRVVLAKRR